MAKKTDRYALSQGDGYYCFNLLRYMENNPAWIYPFLGGEDEWLDVRDTGVKDFIESWCEALNPLTNDHLPGFVMIEGYAPAHQQTIIHTVEIDIADPLRFGIFGEDRNDCTYDLKRCIGTLYDIPAGTVHVAYGEPCTGIETLKLFQFEWKDLQLQTKVLYSSGKKPADLTRIEGNQLIWLGKPVPAGFPIFQ